MCALDGGNSVNEAILVLAGAVVGGVMSALAAVWSSRRQYVRETRVENFRVLLPAVHAGGADRPRPPTDPVARWDELFRAAQGLGGRD